MTRTCSHSDHPQFAHRVNSLCVLITCAHPVPCGVQSFSAHFQDPNFLEKYRLGHLRYLMYKNFNQFTMHFGFEFFFFTVLLVAGAPGNSPRAEDKYSMATSNGLALNFVLTTYMIFQAAPRDSPCTVASVHSLTRQTVLDEPHLRVGAVQCFLVSPPVCCAVLPVLPREAHPVEALTRPHRLRGYCLYS